MHEDKNDTNTVDARHTNPGGHTRHRNVPRRIRSIVHKEVLHRTGRTSFAQLRNVNSYQELSTENSETRRDSIQVLALVISCETLCKCLNLGYFEAIKSKRILKVDQNKFD
ncbi:unnamed protein product [Prunus armeniaca]|uniref:Uncharacterized protein n=1 Tax=Prunus armeniaca TaxID=36596 RepID=A0A6J5VXX7_PRUAR|nr:unnamed protein product [Prunus armeniaca]